MAVARSHARADEVDCARARSLPKSETTKVMSYLTTGDVLAFMKRHRISAD
jgi:hypothetical protein